MNAREPLAVGTHLGDKWIVGKLLGTGGMGNVYSALHQRTEARVAIKVLHQEHAWDGDVVSRFLAEGRAANLVAHPGAVAVIDDGITPGGAPYLVMELLDGESVEQLADRHGGVLPLATVARIAKGALEVIAAAHARGIVHRDLKPENLFLVRDGTVKVLDFGLARLRQTPSIVRLTQTGVPMGTPAFMPPEQALARWNEVDARSDVYALGASIFTLLSGRLVHDGETVPELIVYTTTRQAPPVQSHVPSLPVGLARVIDRSLAFRSQDRWPDAGAMLEAWRAGMAAAGLAHDDPAASYTEDDNDEALTRVALPSRSELRSTTAPVSSVQASPDRRRARLIGVVVAAALALIAVLVAGMLAASYEPRTSTTAPSTTAEAAATASAAPSMQLEPRQASAQQPAVTASGDAAGGPLDVPPAASASARGSGRQPATAARPWPSSTPQPGSATSTADACNPPFTIDERGVKQFKARCMR